MVFIYIIKNIVSSACHGNTLDISSVLVAVVINKTNNLIGMVYILFNAS